MRKINVVYDKKDSILKIKDDSLILSTNEEIIKIPYKDVKDYDYNDKKEELTILRYGGSKIFIRMRRDNSLIKLLEEVKNTEYTTDEEKDIIKQDNNDNIQKELDIRDNTISENITNVSVRKSFVSYYIFGIIVTLLSYAVINYFIFGDIFGYFGGRGKIINTTWNGPYGRVTFFKSGNCEFENIIIMDKCIWKLDGHDITITYSYGNTINQTLKGRFNENYSRLEYKDVK